MHVPSINICTSAHTMTIFFSILLKECYSIHRTNGGSSERQRDLNGRIAIKSESLTFEYRYSHECFWMTFFLYSWKLTLCDTCIYGCAEFIWQNCRVFVLPTWYIAFIDSEIGGIFLWYFQYRLTRTWFLFSS